MEVTVSQRFTPTNQSFLKLSLLFFIILLTTKDVKSQYTIFYADASNVALTKDNVSVCQDESFHNTVRIVVSSSAADNSSVTITLPPGIYYVPGSISTNSSVGGLTISESNITNLSEPIFSIDPADLDAGDEITFSFNRTGDCDATAFQMSGGTFKDAIEVCGDAGCTSDADPAVNSYQLLTPSISLVGEGPITSNIGTNVCRDITLTNGGLGYLDSLKFYIVDQSDETTTSVTTGGGTIITPDEINGDTLCYWLTGAIVEEIGDGDAFIENGEQLVLTRCYDITGCDPISYYGSFWGCPGRCMETIPLMQQTNIPNTTPNLTFTFDGAFSRDYCFKGQNAFTGGTPVVQRFEICNTGAGPATNFEFDMYNSTPGSGTGQNYFGNESANIYDDMDNLIGVTNQTVLYNTNFYQADCSLEAHPAGINHASDVIIQPGTCVYLEMNTYANNVAQNCQGTCRTGLAWIYFNRSYEYQDQCGLNSYGVARQHQAYGGRNLYRYVLEMPTDLAVGEEFELKLNYSHFWNDTKSNTEGETQMKIDVSGTGLQYSGGATVLFKGHNVPVTQVGDLVCVDFPETLAAGSSVLCIPMMATCADGNGTKTLNTYHEGEFDDSCDGEVYHTACGSKSFVMHCPGPCDAGGATPTNFSFERITLGLEDLDNNGIPDGTGTAKPEDVQLHRASNCDTIKAFWEINIYPNTIGANAGNPFNHSYVEFDLMDRNLNCTYYNTDNLFEPIPDAIATIFPEDGSAPYTCEVTASVTGDIAKYDLSPCKGAWEEGDSITFCALMQVTTGFHNSGLTQYTTNNQVYASYDPDPVGANPSADNKYTCDHYNDYMNVYQHYFSPWTPRPQTINGCTGRLNYYLRYYLNTQSGDIDYPFEYRAFTIPDKFRMQVDPAFVVRPGSVRFAGQVVPDADVTQVGDMISICNIKQFFQGYGGTLLENDEAWSYNISFNVDPTCDATPGIYNTRFSSEIIGNGCHSPSSNYIGVTNCANTTGYSSFADVTYNGPQPFMTGGGSVQTTTNDACWDVILNNGSNNVNADFSWFYLDDPSGATGNYVVRNSTGMTLTPDANGFYQLGVNPANGSEAYEVCALTTDCDSSVINLISGFGCAEYPSSIDDIPCGDTTKLVAIPLQSEIQLAVVSEPALPMDLCEEHQFVVKFTSAQAAYLDDIIFNILSPVGLDILNVSAEYPAGSGNIEPIGAIQNGSVYIVNPELHTMISAIGLPGTIDANNPEEREVNVIFDILTDCEFISGSSLLFQAFGDRPCGDPAINNGVRVRSSDLSVNGASLPYSNTMSITLEDGNELVGCTPSQVTIDLDLLSLGALSTSANDSIYITIDPGVEFISGSFNCCSLDPNTCMSFISETVDANGFTNLILAFPAAPIDLSNPANSCFEFQIQNSFEVGCNEPKGINIISTANIGSVPCATAAGGACSSLQVATGQTEAEFTTEKTEVSIDNLAFLCNEMGALEYNFDVLVDNMDVANGDAVFIDIYCATALGTQGAFVQSEAIVGPVVAGTITNVTGTISTGTCNPDYGLFVRINDPDVNGYEQCICEDISYSSGPLVCPPDLEHTKTFNSINPIAPNQWEVKWTIVVENSGLGEGTYNLNDVPGFDDDIEFCGARYTSDAPLNLGNPGPYTLATDGIFELAEDQSIGSGETHTYMLFICVEYDPSSTAPSGDGVYTDCESAMFGNPVSGEGLYNQSELDDNDDGVADEIKSTCSDLPCILKIDSALPGPCMPSNGMYDLVVEVSYGADPGCLLNVGGQTFIVDGSGNQTFTVTGLTADGTLMETVSAFFTCEAACFDQFSYNEPEACMALECEVDGTNILCNGAATGTASVSVTGGITPYSYLWSNGGTSASISSLTANTYEVTITDDEGSTITCDIELTQPTDLVCSIVKDNDISCNGLADGKATASGSGGVSPYTYFWSNGETTAVATALGDGLNTVTITDANDCEQICSVNIIEPSQVSCAIVSFSNLLCNGDDSGAITVSGSGGVAPLEFSLNGGTFQPGTAFNAVPAGSHTITVRDANGCISTCDQVLTEPSILTCAAIENSSASCGMANGEATVTVNGGTPGYSYAWPNGEFMATATNLPAGTHVVTVTDSNDCETTCSVIIMSTTGLMCEISGVSDVTCNGDMDGAATVTGSGGVAPYSYLWSNGATTATVANFSGGDYSVTITDDDGCQVVCTVEILEPVALECMITKDQDISCHGEEDGGATVTISGGTPNYTYAWTGGETTASASMLASGNNVVTITDDNNCQVTCSVLIIEPAVLTCSISSFSNLECNGDDTGTITVSGTGGIAPLEYSIDGGTFQPGTTFTAVSAGAHTITVRDANGCESTCSQSLTEPTALTCEASELSSASCGMANGEASVVPSGGTPGYSYSWPNGETTATAMSLPAGTHTVTVTDANECETTCSVIVMSTTGLMCEISGVSDVTCNGDMDGAATVVGSGGVAPYTYLWSNGATTSAVTNFDGGDYSVTLTDADGCEVVCSVEILEPTALACMIVKNQDISCNGEEDGGATVTVTGGTPNYTFAWPSGESTATATGLASGNNVVTITDASGCEVTCSVDIIEPSAISCSIVSFEDLECNGDDSGTITVSGLGGVAPLEYSIDGGTFQPGTTFTAVTAGMHIITVRDLNGCESTCMQSLAEPPLLSCSVSEDSAASCGMANGIATVSPTGGTPGYTYAWPNGETTIQATALPAGTHVVTVTDNNDCTSTCSVIIMTTSGLMCQIGGVSDVTCNGDMNGAATVMVTGGVTPYTYAWSNGATTAIVTNFSGGDYAVTVTDDDGCQVVCSVEILEPTALECMVVKDQDISCNGEEDGGATVTVSGGTPNYTYAWPSGETTTVATMLASGDNIVTISDENDCEVTCLVNIVEPDELSCTIESFVNLECNGDDSGSITVSGTGGIEPLTFSIDGGAFQPGTTFTAVSAGMHTITVRDANGCESECSQSLTEPPALTCSAVEDSAASCGMANGIATVSPAGGTPGYTYAWPNGETTIQATALPAGTHTVTVTDLNNCTTTCSVIINTTSGLACQIESSSDVTCNGDMDGAATVAVSGGVTPYTYAWSNGATTAIVTNFSGGDYAVTVTDDDGCEVVCSVEILEPTALECMVVKDQDISCNGEEDGGATVTVSGGTPNYTYLWPSGETTAVATMLASGDNVVTITDENNCQVTCLVNIIEPDEVSCAIVGFANLLCNSDDSGSISVSGSGGVAPLTFSIDGGAFQPGTTFNAVSAGMHTITVRDNNDCENNCSQSLTEPLALTCEAVEDSAASCGMSNGIATVTPAGGTAGYTYAWPNGETTIQATALPAGTHTVTVTDANDCTSICSVIINTTSGLTCQIQTSSDVSCNGEMDGTAVVGATGGVTPYTYLWSNGATSAIVVNFSGGDYAVTVTDADGCEVVCSVEILEPTALECMVVKDQDISCNGEQDGAATVFVSGGVPNYTYAWPSGETSAVVTMLAAGDNVVTITDENGCEVTCSVNIVEPAQVSCSIVSFANLECNGDDSGTITVSGAGGVAPLTYSIDGGTFQPGTVFTAVSAGAHTITVRDRNGCESTCDQSLTQPPLLECSVVEDSSASCSMANGEATVTATGGTPGYSYLWGNGETTATAIMLAAGTHFVTITDDNDCEVVCSVLIQSNSDLSCLIDGVSDVTCSGDMDGQATVTGSGGVPPYTYAWSNGETTATVNNFNGGDYTVTMTDADGCDIVCSVEIIEPTTLECMVVKDQDISCNGEVDGGATVTVTGGTPNYTYAWPSGETTAVATMLAAGNNIVTITDENGCEVTCSVNIVEPAQVACSIVSFTNLECHGDDTGSITVSGSGGVAPLTYSIDGGTFQPGTVFTAVTAGAHVITVRDANDCESICNQSLTQPPLLECSAMEDSSASCSMANGEATVTATGGTPGYAYLWGNGETTATATMLAAGTHFVTVTDINDCEVVCSVLIQSNSDLTCLVDGVSDVSCNGDMDGAATVSGSGGVPPYTYAWSTGATTAAVTNFSGGDYTVTVTDADGCQVVCSLEILEPTTLECMVVKDQDISCNGQVDGGATVTVTGGTPNYTYAWPSGETTAVATMLAAGDNVVTITDENDCEVTCSINIIEPPMVSCMVASTMNPVCFETATGQIIVTGNGGAGILNYSLNGGGFQPGNTFDNVLAGMHTITVRDQNDCESSCMATLTDPDELTCTTEFLTPTACDRNDGSASVNPVGGTGPYTYLWDNLETTQIAVSLSQGVHNVTVTDSNDCTTECAVTVDAVVGLVCDVTAFNNVSCFGAEDGGATVEVSGGSMPYSYLWSNGATTPVITNFSGGMYDITVTDGDGCSMVCNVTIAEPVELVCSINKINDISCFSADDGSAEVDVSGGTINYSYLWSNGETTAIAANLVPGANAVTVTDMNGCEVICSLEIEEPMQLSCTATSTPTECMGQNNGTITIEATGGNAPLSYSLDGGFFQPGNTFNNLGAGVYSIEVSDVNGCQTACAVEVGITGCEFDLALTKKLTPGQDAFVNPGDPVNYTITVVNQGQIPADNIEITDYIPNGLNFVIGDATNITYGWIVNTPNIETTLSVASGQLPAGGLAPNGGTVQIEVVLMVAANAPQGMMITNVAEISSATDENGLMQADLDGSFDDNNSNDGVPDDDSVNNENGDEDNHDPESITINYFDLALTKTLATGQPGTIAPGDDVTFALTIYNQGTIAADNIMLTDYLSSCMTLNDPDWNGVGTVANYLVSHANGDLDFGGLQPNDFVQILITVQVNGSATNACDLTNWAEISDDTDGDGDPIDDQDSVTDSDDSNDIYGADNEMENANGDEDDHDQAMVSLLTADLALAKDLGTGENSSVSVGQQITFTITVENQGDIPADNIVIADYLDACMTLSDADWTGSNPAYYTVSAANGDLPMEGLLPMQQVEIDITVTIACAPETGQLVNVAEITSFTDEENNPMLDEDSTPDDNPDNDPPLEDDIDSEPLNILEFDLALSKDLGVGQESQIIPGELVEYAISIVNQGQIPADNIKLIDYIPSCMALADNAWTMQGSDAVYTVSVMNGDLSTGGLAPGETVHIPITLQLLNPMPANCELRNCAEIGNATDNMGGAQTDRDSNPDEDLWNDPPGEDDKDDQLISVLEFDLALTKNLAFGQSSEVMIGDMVDFTFTVFNQGEIAADNIEITDYLPPHFVLSDLDWSGTMPTTTLSVANGMLPAGGLMPGQQVMVEITLMVLNIAVEGDTYTNTGEISSATDLNGNVQVDRDSDPDNDITNDAFNEDDIDEESVTIMGLCDLALVKSCGSFDSNGDGTGGLMTFDLTVINQGSCPAYNVFIVDYIGEQFTVEDASWFVHPFDGNAYFNIPGPIMPGTSETISITLGITSFDPDEINWNWAEIAGSRDFNGDMQDDVDSYPDFFIVNDGIPWDDVIDNSFFDEDDQDIENVCVMDFSLDKELDPSVVPPHIFGDDILFNICITNEGNMVANEVTVTDYVPSGFDFDPTKNPNWIGGAPTVTHTFAGPIFPGDQLCQSIVLEFTSLGNNANDYTNTSEITEVLDETGAPHFEDWDSTPANDDGDQSEDDEDAVMFRVFDLALKKRTDYQGPFKYDNDITFELSIFNQGSVPAFDIAISDHVPCGYLFVEDPAWVFDTLARIATHVIPGPLMPGDSIDVALTLNLQPCIEQDAWKNIAEISSAYDDLGMLGMDVDSDLDTDPFNDVGGTPETDEDDHIDDDGLDSNGDGITDEDDHDPHEPWVFDLAQIKQIPAGPGPYLFGDMVEYVFTIYNQGNKAATFINIVDYLPVGLVFNPSYVHPSGMTANANANWVQDATTGYLTTTLLTDGSSLDPGQTTQVVLYLEVAPGNSVEDWFNYSEIMSSLDTEGILQIDADGDFDDDPSNDDDPTDPFDYVNDALFCEGGDEDNHDGEEIIVAGKVGDTVWKDLDGDGIQDESEPGVSGVGVTLFTCAGEEVANTVTNQTGFYEFNNVIPGDYYVTFDISAHSADCTFTFKDAGEDTLDSDANASGVTECFTAAGIDITDIDAGLIPLGCIGKCVWHDLNGNGSLDTNEPRISNLLVHLKDFNGNLLQSTKTNSDGEYEFDQLWPGYYYLEFVRPSGFSGFTVPNIGGNDNTDSDVDHSNGEGTTSIIEIGPGECNESIYAGLYICIPVGDLLWYDSNNNGIQDPQENGINNVKVRAYRIVEGATVLYDDTYTGHKPGTPSDDGYWKMCLPPGQFYFHFDVSENLTVAPANRGNNDALDNDIDNSNGTNTTSTMSFQSGDYRVDIDGAYIIGNNLSEENSAKRLTHEEERDISIPKGRFDNKTVVLDWEARKELKEDEYYLIERLDDDQKYVAIDKIFIAGNDSAISQYEYLDYDAKGALMIYRISLVNSKEEAFILGEIILDRPEEELAQIVRLYPNVTTDLANLRVEVSEATEVELSVFDISGKVLKENLINDVISKGATIYKIDTDGMKAGSYILRISLNGKITTRRLIVVGN